jgi:hypothetical protein
MKAKGDSVGVRLLRVGVLRGARSAGVVIALFFGRMALAAGPTNVYSNGGSHTISTALAVNVEVLNQTSLTIAPTGILETSFPPVARVLNQGRLIVSGQIIGNGSGTDAPAVDARNNASVEVIGGFISAEGSGASGTTHRAGVRLTDNASLRIVSGTIQESGSGIDLDRAGVLAEGNSRVTMLGGLVQSVGSGIDTEWIGILARGQAQVDILGGDIIARSSNPGADLAARNLAQIRIYGQNFNLGFGPVAATSGVITGQLWDGSFAEFSFRRDTGAKILLSVPEPSTMLVAAGAIMIVGCVGVRRRRGIC